MANSVFVTLLGDGVHLILANPRWRQLQERAQKILGDKKHVEGMLSQSHCVAQSNTAHELSGEFIRVKREFYRLAWAPARRTLDLIVGNA